MIFRMVLNPEKIPQKVLEHFKAVKIHPIFKPIHNRNGYSRLRGAVYMILLDFFCCKFVTCSAMSMLLFLFLLLFVVLVVVVFCKVCNCGILEYGKGW